MQLTRRQTLVGLGLTSGVLFSHHQSAAAKLSAGRLGRVLRDQPYRGATRQTPEGPFYLDDLIERSEITEGRPGVPVEFVIAVIDAKSRSALAGARVDIWQADATGCYSGFQGQGDERTVSTVGKRFLRGTQYVGPSGQARFATIYPGWYAGRTAHIHFKVFVDDTAASIGQVYFPDDLNRFVFTTVPPYSTRKYRRDTLNRDDPVLSSSGGGQEVFAAIDMTADRLIAGTTVAVG